MGSSPSLWSAPLSALCSLIQEENSITAVPPLAEKVKMCGGDARTSEEGNLSTDPQESSVMETGKEKRHQK